MEWRRRVPSTPAWENERVRVKILLSPGRFLRLVVQGSGDESGPGGLGLA